LEARIYSNHIFLSISVKHKIKLSELNMVTRQGSLKSTTRNPDHGASNPDHGASNPDHGARLNRFGPKKGVEKYINSKCLTQTRKKQVKLLEL